MRDEYLIERHGKKYVLFTGLLDEAHTQGLSSIETDLLQVPAAENGNLAIVKASVKMEGDRLFEGIGDASPDNVGRNIAPHLIRMAETRAKARALRDAINVGVTALEETYDEPQQQSSSSNSGSGNVTNMREAQARTKQATEKQENTDKLPVTRKQLNYLDSLLEDNDDVRERLEQKYGKTVQNLTRGQASEAINTLSGQRSG